MPADLHCHTKISDGSTSIEDLIAIAKLRRITTLAITDHDTVAGVTRAQIIGRRSGIEIIPGAEFSCMDSRNGKKVHLLAYMFTSPDRLESMCKKISTARSAAAVKMIGKVARFYPINLEMVKKVASGSTNIFKQHIMHALMNAGYSPSVFGELYTRLFDYENGSCIVNPEYPDVFEVLELLKSAGAIAILAHPSAYDSMYLIPELIDAGIDGFEVWHPRNTEGDRQKLLEYAEKHSLLTTGGSDFHGMYCSHPVALGTCSTPDDCLAAMKARHDRQQRAKAHQ